MDVKFIKYIPKTLQDDFIDNKVIPFVGAGFSKNGTLPEGITMPDWNELGRKIASYISDYEYTNPLDALSLFESEYSRVKLVEVLAKELHINEIKPSDTYIAFCNLFFETICTTNFDFVIDHTLMHSNRPHSIIVSEDRLPISTKETTKLVKLHGDFNHPKQMVITEKDYDEFLDNNKILATYVSNLFITKTLFLVGYSFDDADLRGLWQIINSRLGNLNRLAYCVMVDASKTEIARFERRNVKVINLPGKKSEYRKILKQFFEEIKQLIDEKTPKLMKATNDRAIEELLLPDEESRVCYIAAPFPKIPFLKEMLYPVLYKCGVTPISLDEIILPSDNWMTKSEALTRKSFMAVVDISGDNKNVLWELGSLNNSNKDLILISEQNGGFSLYPEKPQNNKVRVLFYSTGNTDNFISQFEDSVMEITKNNRLNNLDEAKRLLKKNEYDAAVISAFRALEKALREFCGVKYNLSLGQMFKEIVTKHKEIKVDNDEITTLVKTRNNLVHAHISVNKTKAVELIKIVEGILIKLPQEGLDDLL